MSWGVRQWVIATARKRNYLLLLISNAKNPEWYSSAQYFPRMTCLAASSSGVSGVSGSSGSSGSNGGSAAVSWLSQCFTLSRGVSVDYTLKSPPTICLYWESFLPAPLSRLIQGRSQLQGTQSDFLADCSCVPLAPPRHWGITPSLVHSSLVFSLWGKHTSEIT